MKSYSLSNRYVREAEIANEARIVRRESCVVMVAIGEAMNPIRVILGDDHALVRAGFRSLLQEFDGIEVVGEAEDGHAILKVLKETQADVLLLDVSMKGLNGLEVLARVSKVSHQTRVIMLSMHANEEYVSQSLKGGACGYLLKDAAPQQLELAIRSVARGEI